MATKQPILSLDELTERPIVRIAGADYEMRRPGELTAFEYHRIAKRWTLYQSTIEQDAPSEEAMNAAAAAMSEIVRQILIAPDDIHARLSASACLRIAMAFMKLEGDLAGDPARAQPIAPPAAVDPAPAAAPDKAGPVDPPTTRSDQDEPKTETSPTSTGEK